MRFYHGILPDRSMFFNRLGMKPVDNRISDFTRWNATRIQQKYRNGGWHNLEQLCVGIPDTCYLRQRNVPVATPFISKLYGFVRSRQTYQKYVRYALPFSYEVRDIFVIPPKNASINVH